MGCMSGWDETEGGTVPVTIYECPDCGGDVNYDGDAIEGCDYAEIECETCGSAPCEEDC